MEFIVKLLVTITVKNFDALATFETAANQIMKDYDGKITQAFELVHNEDGSGTEIHIVEFANSQCFEGYRQDSRHADLANLRAQAISAIEVKPVLKEKTY